MPTAHRHLWILASFASPALQIIQILITFSPTIGKGSFPKTRASLASSAQKPCIICIICIKNTPNFATFAPPPFGSSPPPNFKFPLPQICPPTASPPPTPPNTHFVRWSDLQPSLRLAFVKCIKMWKNSNPAFPTLAASYLQICRIFAPGGQHQSALSIAACTPALSDSKHNHCKLLGSSKASHPATCKVKLWG